MGRPAGWMQKLTGRGAMRSPGAPSLRCEIERRFWEQIATGITSERAAEAVGVSQAHSGTCVRHVQALDGLYTLPNSSLGQCGHGNELECTGL